MNNHKLDQDLKFIKDFTVFAHKLGWRQVLYGGYGLDFYLGRITRSHRDIDLVIYGQNDRSTARKLINEYLSSTLVIPDISFDENDFQLVADLHSRDFALNLYYIQTENDPFVSLSHVVKKSGETVYNDPSLFPPPQKGSLQDLQVEVQDQQAHLAEILAKDGLSNPKYQNDIKLLSALFSSI